MTAGPLAGRVALVAGGTGAIGRHVATGLAAAGAAVAVHCHRSAGQAAEIVRECGGGLAVCAALPGPRSADRLVSTVEAELGPVTILVNAAEPAGAAGVAAVADIEPGTLERHLDGVRAHHELCRRVLPGMRAAGFGRIVFVSGALMARPMPGMGAYAAAKAAASVLTRYVAAEEGRYGITANVVAPGRVAEPDAGEPDDPALRELSEALRRRMALPRFPAPREVARTVVALVSPEFDQVTGQTVWMTGGEFTG
ncbi:SDR family oxidoreductase [Streptosporangium sp. NPDC049046]|uniref:SDR family NAD(P)-dependent oxidoreductase n=1 Tax=Streptosporangium sp. NPDC049046 TaxID=3155031 RepID=UPI00341563C8